MSNISLHISSCFRHTSGPMLSSSHFSSSFSNMDDNNSHLLSLVVVEAAASSHWKPHFQQMGALPISCCSCFALLTVCRSISPQTWSVLGELMFSIGKEPRVQCALLIFLSHLFVWKQVIFWQKMGVNAMRAR